MEVTLHWSDYFILALSLFAYALVGLYFRWSTQINNFFDRCQGRPIKEVKPQTAQEIFLANRQLGVLPVMASTAASFLSAATLMGNHLEIYLYGFPVLANSISYLVLFPLVSEIYMPVLYKLNLLSINQYFAMRFGGCVKILATITFILQMASNQAQVQRYLSCKSLKTAKTAILLNIPINILFTVLHVAVGLISYVYFRGCDPKLSGQLARHDMLFPFLTLKLFDNIPLLRGLVLSVIFAAAFSTISSGLNSLAAVGMQDVFLPIYKNKSSEKEIGVKRLALISRLLAIVLGFVTTGIAIILIYASPNIIRIILSVFGATGGPIFLLHTMGIFFPFINNWGACAGFVVSVVGTMWVSIGGIFRNTIADIPGRPPSTDACPTPDTTTLAPNLTTLASASQPKPVDTDFSFYDLSFLWLTAFAMLIGFMVASIVSLLSGMNTKNPVRQSLLASQAVSFYKCLRNCFPNQFYDDNDSHGEVKDGS
ncbi:hypothetical protein SprV_0501810700 [Sparganum proliferum]